LASLTMSEIEYDNDGHEVELQHCADGELEAGTLLATPEEKPSKWRKRIAVGRICVEAALVLMLIVGIVVLSVLIAVEVSDKKKKKDDDSSIVKPEFSYSTEYQVSLFTDDWDSEEKRENMVIEFLDHVNSHMGTDLAIDDGDVVVRKQYYYHLKGEDACDVPYLIRVREHLSGVDSGLAYMDIKYSNSKQEKACSVPLWPANSSPMDLFAGPDTYLTKCENDVHACSEKYSMESRMVLKDGKEPPKLTTCNDVTALFPWALEDTTEAQRFNEISKGSTSVWWEWSYVGHVDSSSEVSDSEAEDREGKSAETTQFKIDYTLEYSSQEHAEKGNKEPKNGSEWSMKIYELSSGGYDKTIKKNAEKLHADLLKVYGSKGELEDGECV